MTLSARHSIRPIIHSLHIMQTTHVAHWPADAEIFSAPTWATERRVDVADHHSGIVCWRTCHSWMLSCSRFRQSLWRHFYMTTVASLQAEIVCLTWTSLITCPHSLHEHHSTVSVHRFSFGQFQITAFVTEYSDWIVELYKPMKWNGWRQQKSKALCVSAWKVSSFYTCPSLFPARHFRQFKSLN